MNLENTVRVIHPSQKVKFNNSNPTRDDVIEYMSTSIDILDWNLKRARIKRIVGDINFLKKYSMIIDTDGLCVRVMKLSTARKSYHVPFNINDNK